MAIEEKHDDRTVASHKARQASEGRAATARRKVSAWTRRQQKRDKIAATGLLGVRHHEEMHYSQAYGKRMWGVVHKVRPPSVPPYEDCSSFATWLYWVAGAPDPNGRGYDGHGYTGTQIENGWEVETARKGDLAFYGSSRGNITHVAIVCEGGAIAGAKVVSFGNEYCPCGPIPVRYRADFQFLRRYIR